ncbi:flagellar biosynthetic protein FliR [Paucimonas lemoignei]|uniref:Flagellar biosynthetic protein FliR n=1 Tax=Paucimonas lemoignei TaxID=29443 RepID=A0A4R3I1H4_PAULE|nr:flagellar biosynthetic protein FliR [Paucimonas lemoignei]TCS37709.1 flagellar biosynthetic protein FliR [Paucimonas lemoignei]
MQNLMVHLASAWMIAVILVSIRIGMVLVMTPVLGSTGLPARIKVLFVFAFSAALVSMTGLHLNTAVNNPINLLIAVLNEIVWGGLLGLGLLAAFSAFMVAGRVLDMQIGFGLANLFDPSTRTNAPLLGVALHLYAIAWFLAVDAHHVALRGLAKSFDLAPLGASLREVPLDAIVHHFGLSFSLGLVLVGAAVVCLLLVDIGMGVASRVLPQANVFILSMTVKIFAGLVTLAIAVLYMQPVIKKLFEQVFNFWEAVLVN